MSQIGGQADPVPGADETSGPVAEPARARRRRVAGGRNRQCKARFTEAEADRIERAAAAAGMSAPNWLAETALAATYGGAMMPVAARRALARELSKVSRDIAGASTNVNQLAAKMNATGQVPPAQLDATLDHLNRVLAKITAFTAAFHPDVLGDAPRGHDVADVDEDDADDDGDDVREQAS